MTHSVGKVVEMAKALSEGDFNLQFDQQFHGELGQLAAYLEAVRQTLQSLAVTDEESRALIPNAANGVAEINREAEKTFNSVWDVIERIQDDQALARGVLGAAQGGLAAGEVRQLSAIAEKHQQELLALMSYLSFQDVLRQRLEKIQKIIAQVEDKTLELMVKFKVKTKEKSLMDGAAEAPDLGNAADLDQDLVDRLMATLR